LEKSQIKNIVEIQITKLNKTLAEHKLKIVLTEKAKEFLADVGFDPDFGARPLKRAIQNYIQNQLSLKLLEGEFIDGDLIEADIDNKKDFSFKKIGNVDF
jgi:ATP-dependent Clp protease ATP-binding subunit ClpB